MTDPLLIVSNLSIDFGRHRRPALTDVSFELADNERLGIIGESGSGKTVTALAIMGLLPETATASGSIRLRGNEMVNTGDRELAPLRGNLMSMVFQEPMTALDPTMRVGRQVAEVLTLHQHSAKEAARSAVVAMLARVGLPDPERIADAYPH
ncbi:MAG TPA: ABC transporter ATP-binding protein, partial [Propionibacteriaceae bacterium]|nr:ABC transporter ATP-binding protein [Propionibacteriaceae bacterium]